MQQEIDSPFVPLRELSESGGQIRLMDALGCAVDLLRHTEVQARQALGRFVEELLMANKEERFHIALDDRRRPLGLAVWRWIDKDIQGGLLRGEALHGDGLQLGKVYFVDDEEMVSSALWFTLFLAPLSAEELLVRQLRERFPVVSSAWAASPDGSEGVRIW